MRISAVLTSIFATLLFVASCASVPEDAAPVERAAAIYPDYSDITIPYNIAPLNFRICDSVDGYVTVLSGKNGTPVVVGGREVRVPARKWASLLEANIGGEITVRIFEKTENGWEEFPAIVNRIAKEPVDEYVSYRLIEPTYGMSGEIRLVQRNLSSFAEKEIYSNMLSYDRKAGQCVNCHSFQNYGTSNYQFHVRQKDGGTVIVNDGKPSKVNLRRDGILSAGVYPSWHPQEKLIAYSVNSTYQNFFPNGTQKTEVTDEASDLMLYDVEKDEVIPVLTDTSALETFPYWAPDGSSLFYACASLDSVERRSDGKILSGYDQVHYNILRMTFDRDIRAFSEPELVYDAASLGKSATLPRLSPDGRYLLFTLGEFGNFHIWHKDADLYIKDMQDGCVRCLENVNSDDVESYHSWSSNGRWIVFSSRRDDGLYTRLYLAYFDNEGRAHKPFVIPTERLDDYMKLFKSFNIPEFTVEPVRQNPKGFL